MKNQRSFAEQLFQTLLLGAGLMLLFNYFFGQGRQNTGIAPRPALTLSDAFRGIDPAQGAPLAEAEARAEIKGLREDIERNPNDPLAHWARLRIGLLQQYVTDELESETRSTGFLGFGPKAQYFPVYDEIVQANQQDAIEAQALYQTGDRLWRKSTENGGQPAPGAITSFETMVQRGRSNSDFLGHKIYVPNPQVKANERFSPGEIPSGGFALLSVRELKGDISNTVPVGILDRINAYYSSELLYKIFDSVTRLFGENKFYSYGLAILAFAIFTRVVMQPIYRKQYDSMKGMALIAPEMKKLQEKFKDKKEPDAQMQQMKEMRALYRRHGVNPAMGCGLSLLQMPIFFFLVYPMIQHYEPKLDLVNASFLWINALARPDIPLLILYGISMFLSFRLSSTPPADEMQRQQQLMLSLAMPFLFPLFLLSYPSAFTLYWMTYNVISTIFQWRMIKAADPTKTVRGALFGGFQVVNPTADAVPAHPNSEDKKENKKAGKPALEAASPLNGTRDSSSAAVAESNVKTVSANGNSGGSNTSGSNSGSRKRGRKRRSGANGSAPHSAPENAVLSPSDPKES